MYGGAAVFREWRRDREQVRLADRKLHLTSKNSPRPLLLTLAHQTTCCDCLWCHIVSRWLRPLVTWCRTTFTVLLFWRSPYHFFVAYFTPALGELSLHEKAAQWVKAKSVCDLKFNGTRRPSLSAEQSSGRAYLTSLPCISCQHHFTVKKGFQSIPIANYMTGCLSTKIKLF